MDIYFFSSPFFLFFSLVAADDASSCAVKLADFGNAIPASQLSLYYQEFDVQSPWYRAPEVMQREEKKKERKKKEEGEGRRRRRKKRRKQNRMKKQQEVEEKKQE